jgi:SET domain-containing protein
VKKIPVKGRTLFATENIPKGHFVQPNDAAVSMRIDRIQWEALNKFISDFPEADQFRELRDFYLAYGFESDVLGVGGWAVSIAGISSFMNHACLEEERNVDPNMYLQYGEDGNAEVQFSPPMNRRAELLGVLAIASRDIMAGEEIAIDYHLLRNAYDELDSFLKHVCSNGVGLVHDSVDDA